MKNPAKFQKTGVFQRINDDDDDDDDDDKPSNKNSAHVECESESATSNNWGNLNQLKITQAILEQHIGKA